MNEKVIKSLQQISLRDERVFSQVYDTYYTYLNTLATYYVFDRDVANEIVNNVFIKLWDSRESITYPVLNYLMKATRNGCFNHLRSVRNANKVLDRYHDVLARVNEEHVLENPEPLQYVEIQELEALVRESVSRLPAKCREIVKRYLFCGENPNEIAIELNLSTSTVRVQIKNGLDKIRVALGHLLIVFLLVTGK